MDTQTNIERVERMLRRTCGCSKEESIVILRACLAKIHAELNAEAEAERVRTEAIAKRIEERRLREAERLRIHGYKRVRFKKPLPPIEERKQYVRCCKICDEYYRTFAKYGKVCDNCKKGGVSDGVPRDLHNRSYKTETKKEK